MIRLYSIERNSGTDLCHQRLFADGRLLIAVLGAGPAFFVTGYTGVLLAVTAVSIWTGNYLLMGPLFMASAMSSGEAAIALVLSCARGTTRETLRRLEPLDSLAMPAELALLIAARAPWPGNRSPAG